MSTDPPKTWPDPDPGAVAGVLSGLAFVAAVGGAVQLGKGPFPRPGASAAQIRDYYRDSATAARFSAAGQLVSIVSLVRFTASVARLAARPGVGSGVLPAAAVASGAAAALALTAAAARHLTLTLPSDRDEADWSSGSRFVFLAGGPLHGVVYGLFTGVLALAGRRAGVLGPASTALGVVSAAAGLLSPLYFRWETAGWLIPAGRFSGYLVSGIAGTRLARGAR